MNTDETELFAVAKAVLESSFGVRQAFEILPPNCKILVALDNRLVCTMELIEGRVAVSPEAATNTDIKLTLYSEAIRRLKTQDSADLTQLALELISLRVAGYLKMEWLIPVTSLKSKGYLESVKKLGPEVQKALTQHAFSLAGHAQSAIDKLKSWVK